MRNKVLWEKLKGRGHPGMIRKGLFQDMPLIWEEVFHAEGTARAHAQEGGWAIRATERKPKKLDQCQRDELLPDRDEWVSWGQITEGLGGHGKRFGSH